jgi:hypothetical protein
MAVRPRAHFRYRAATRQREFLVGGCAAPERRLYLQCRETDGLVPEVHYDCGLGSLCIPSGYSYAIDPCPDLTYFGAHILALFGQDHVKKFGQDPILVEDDAECIFHHGSRPTIHRRGSRPRALGKCQFDFCFRQQVDVSRPNNAVCSTFARLLPITCLREVDLGQPLSEPPILVSPIGKQYQVNI